LAGVVSHQEILTRPKPTFCTLMTVAFEIIRWCVRAAAQAASIAVAVGLLVGIHAGAQAQSHYSKSFPARHNVRLRLTNWSGSIKVEAWARDEIKIVASLESPASKFTPVVQDDSIEINVIRDNPGHGEVGSVNFVIQVPINSTVDVETRIGDISVNGVQGTMVRAHVTSEGDVTLTGIRAYNVIGENVSGNILFDGELQQGGTYGFTSSQGNINIRIPANSAFRLNAMAPGTHNIGLGGFSTSNLLVIGDGRKVVGSVGDGRATLDVRNQRGSISFFRR
jgi:hypothetical protein